MEQREQESVGTRSAEGSRVRQVTSLRSVVTKKTAENNMKSIKTIIAISSIAAFAVVAVPSANALGLNDDNYVGRVDPGTPADPADEAVYAQYLIDLFNAHGNTGATYGPVSFPGIPTAQSFTLTTGGVTGPLPDFDAAGVAYHATTGSGDLDTSGTYAIGSFAYIYAYYGNGATDSNGAEGSDGQLWYVGDLIDAGVTSVSIPTKALSHVTFVGHVPDGGATLVLLGAGLLAVGGLRRRLSK